MKDDFECLRCGNCCETYAVNFPGGERKEAFTLCDHLRQSVFKKGMLTLAACSLHGNPDQPDVCDRTFRTNSILSDFEGPCKIGKTVWAKRSARYGIERMPERVRKVLKKRQPV
jgi:hypothetical protein